MLGFFFVVTPKSSFKLETFLVFIFLFVCLFFELTLILVVDELDFELFSLIFIS